MPFVWINEPQSPPQVEPIFYGSNTVSNQVGLVANTVEIHPPPMGVLDYNTPNIGYDVVYSYDRLNVSTLHTDHLIGGNITANTATINTLAIDTATIGNASFSNLTASYIYMTGNVSANMHMATKGYVDSLVANSTPEGGNLQLLIQAAGDLLAGVADNTANRVAVGTNSQVLLFHTTPNTKMRWGGPFGRQEAWRGLYIRTHPNYPLCNTKIQLLRCEELVMNDGFRSANWPLLTLDATSNGAVNRLDTGVLLANTWYEIHAIRNPTTGDRGLLMHRCLDRHMVLSQLTSDAGSSKLGTQSVAESPATLLSKLAQQFVAPITGKLTGITILTTKFGSMTGNVWMTIEQQDGTGNASGVPLATSDIKYPHDFPFSITGQPVNRVRFTFNSPATLTQNSSYCFVVSIDSPIGTASNGGPYFSIGGQTTLNPYTPGNVMVYSVNTASWMPGTSTAPAGLVDTYFQIYMEANNTSLVLPSGYTQNCLISYAATNMNGHLKEYTQWDRTISLLWHYTWRWHSEVDGTAYVPFAQITYNPQTVESINCEYGVPPIPCIVTFLMTGGLTGVSGFGSGYAPAITGNNSPSIQNFTETESIRTAHVSGGFGQTCNPIYIDNQVVNFWQVTNFPDLGVSTIEF